MQPVHSTCSLFGDRHVFMHLISIFFIKNPPPGLLDGYRISVAMVPIFVQPTVTFPIGDHVNVLHDYKKMGP